MSDKIYDVPADWAKRAWADQAKYKEMYARSISDPNAFWAEQARRIGWMKPFTKVENASFAPGKISIKWFEDGVVNAAYNCVDRHLKTSAAIRPPSSGKATIPLRRPATSPIAQLHDDVCRFANILRNRNVEKGDRVTIYLPMIRRRLMRCSPARASAPSIRWCSAASRRKAWPAASGLPPRSSSPPMKACAAASKVPLKKNTDDAAIAKSAAVSSAWSSSFAAPAAKVDMESRARPLVPRRRQSGDRLECPCEHMNAEDPLFILYTSGSTGKPKGVLHTTGGYLVFAAMTHQYVFDYHDGDIFWCTADVGWVTGHSYIVYGPLANGATTLMFEGVPNYPDDASRFWEVVDKHKVNIFYTAPTAIRALMQGRRRPRKKTSRKSLVAAATRQSWASRSIRRRGSGITAWSATAAARSSTPGGRPRPAAS